MLKSLLKPTIDLMDLEHSLLKIIRGEKKAPILMGGLAALSTLYRSAIAARNLAYDRGWISSIKLPAVVVSIGNIVVGGTGKTPLVHLLASELQSKVQLAILTRGYRSSIERSGRCRQISSGNGPLCQSEECGDEPYFLAQKTRASIWVGGDRVASGRLAIAEGANCLLLDDGMQHRGLKRDFEIVILDGTDPFSKERFLPWGLLRDTPKRLRFADLIVFTHVKDQKHHQQLQKQLSPFTHAPAVAFQIEVLNKQLFPPRKVGVFCGIGKPTHFLQTIRDLKSEIVDTLILKDHASLQKGELRDFAKKCREKGAEALLCTEKDYVKISPDPSLCLKIDPVEIQLKILTGKEHWETLIENILDRIFK
ncbi:MAG: tetraacyldisaccharide 4'-kinase [Rhabdochlamydiaceae bacterium]|jgi:tetraacyldisaccharide 4'-kinase